jgi:hypothetical protein
VTPHIAQNTSGRRSAIDGTRHPGYGASQRVRNPALDEATKARLRVLPSTCDPVLLLAAIRAAQAELGERIDRRGATAVRQNPVPVNLDRFVASLATAWREGEQRPTHKRAYRRRKPVPKRPSMLEALQEEIHGWLAAEPGQRRTCGVSRRCGYRSVGTPPTLSAYRWVTRQKTRVFSAFAVICVSLGSRPQESATYFPSKELQDSRASKGSW